MGKDSRWGQVAVAFLALVGVAGLAVGGTGLYLTLTGSGEPPARGAEVLGEFGCEPADRDVGSVPEATYGVERVLARGDKVESVETDATGEAARMTLTLSGRVLNASAARFGDRTADAGPNVTVLNGTRVAVVDPDRRPFRLWIDTVTRDGTVVRTELDVCPPP